MPCNMILACREVQRALLPLQVLYMLACIVVLDYLHDAWFYWTHRMLHWGPLYRHVHYIHHK